MELSSTYMLFAITLLSPIHLSLYCNLLIILLIMSCFSISITIFVSHLYRPYEEKHRISCLNQEDCCSLCSQEPSSWLSFSRNCCSVQCKGSSAGKSAKWEAYNSTIINNFLWHFQSMCNVIVKLLMTTQISLLHPVTFFFFVF